MKIAWFGYGGNQWLVERYRDLIQEMGHELITCHEYDNATVKYRADTINQFLDSADVIYLPHRRTQPAKSVNKLAIAWSRGKACIVGKRSSYLKYANPENSIIIDDENPDELVAAIRSLENEEFRKSLGNKGWQVAQTKLNPTLMINHFFSAMKIGKKHVHIVIPHYASAEKYIALAVESVLKSEGDFDFTVSVVSSAKEGPPKVSGPKVEVYHQYDRLSFSKAVNLGLRKAPPQTTHFLVFNDDAILSREALQKMLMAMGEDEIILNPWSNCDKGWLHNDNLLLGPNKALIPNMVLEDFTSEELESLFQFQPLNYAGARYSGCNFCALYCTLFPKSVYEKVGQLNEEFSNGGEDADFSYRASRLGIMSCWTREAFVFHFGGKSRKISHLSNPEAHVKEDNYNNLLLHKRWPKDRKRIAIWTGPAWERWDMDSPYTTGIGGSETCVIRLAEHAAALGHNVTLFGDHDHKEQNGVMLRHYTEYKPQEEYWDLFIASRNVSPINNELRAKKVLVWVHDIWLLSGQGIPTHVLDKVDRFVCLSPWHKEFFIGYHKVNPDKVIIIPNGVDVKIYQNSQESKVFGKLHFSSSPDRGLDNLLYCLPYIKEHVPELHLDVYYGFFNWKSAVESRKNPAEMANLERMQKLIEDCKDFVFFKDRVNQKQLAEAWSKAYMWLYPTRFTETYCITANEAMLTGTPIICSDIAALNTTVGNYGIRLKHDPYSREGRQQLVDDAVRLLKNKDLWSEASLLSYSGSQGIAWENRWDDYWSHWL